MALSGIYRCTSVFQILRFSKLPPVSPKFLTERCIQTPRAMSLSSKLFYKDRQDSPATPAKPGGDPYAAPPKKKKPLKSPEITLISHDDVVSSVTLEDAEKLAKRRNLKLVKIVDFDTKTERPVYKIMSPQQYFLEEAKTKEKKKKERDSAVKDDKLFTMSTKIDDHDLYNKVKQMHKALKKKHGVRAFISQDGNPERATELADVIEEELADLGNKSDRSARMQGTIKLHFTPKLDSETSSSQENKGAKKKEKKVTEDDKKSLKL